MNDSLLQASSLDVLTQFSSSDISPDGHQVESIGRLDFGEIKREDMEGGAWEGSPGSFCGPASPVQRQRNPGKGRTAHCSVCGKSFSRDGSLKLLLHVHRGEKPYPCSECGKRFTRQAHLRGHQRIHTGEKPYHCPDCGTWFSDKRNLKTHRRVHTGKKPYYCSECGACFSDRGNLKRHQRIHTGEKPYYCSECGRSFRHSDTVKKHKCAKREAKAHDT